MKKKPPKYPAASSTRGVLKDAVVLEGPVVINVRAAKDKLSSLIERAATGLETIIASGTAVIKIVSRQFRNGETFRA